MADDFEEKNGEQVKVGEKFSLVAVYETLYSGHNFLAPVQHPRQFLTLLDYSIAYRFTQCDTERPGRVMNLMKSPDRSSLGDDNFSASVFVAYNSPPIDKIDFKQMAKRFCKKHKPAVMGDRCNARGKGSRIKQVIERHSAISKHTFFT